jgi:hypothetical protein
MTEKYERYEDLEALVPQLMSALDRVRELDLTPFDCPWTTIVTGRATVAEWRGDDEPH